MRHSRKYRAAGAAAFGLALMLTLQPARAEMEVTDSSAPGIQAGDTLKDNAEFDLPEGASVSLLLKPSGSTKTLKGPFKGTLATYKEKRSWMDRLMGKGDDVEPPMGASRGFVTPK